MADRNVNPHAEARIAMLIWSSAYMKQRGGCMDFYDQLSASEKRQCQREVDLILEARRARRIPESDTHA